MSRPGEIQGNYSNFLNSVQTKNSVKDSGNSFQDTLAGLVYDVNKH